MFSAEFRRYKCVRKTKNDGTDCTLSLKSNKNDTEEVNVTTNKGCFDEKNEGEQKVWCPMYCRDAVAGFFVAKVPSANHKCVKFFTYKVEQRANEWYFWRSGDCLNTTMQFDLGCSFSFDARPVEDIRELMMRVGRAQYQMQNQNWFRYTPITKAWICSLLSSSTTYMYVNMYSSSPLTWVPSLSSVLEFKGMAKLLLSKLFFGTPSLLITGIVLLYYGRWVERRFGSKKFIGKILPVAATVERQRIDMIEEYERRLMLGQMQRMHRAQMHDSDESHQLSFLNRLFASRAPDQPPSEDQVRQLMDMGFGNRQMVVEALRQNGNDASAAANQLLHNSR
ncbi:Uncharacterized protein T05H10.3 [Toxocara canis]|uniref:Uncharacterized protein T05H10.3 n=1 Tax=Toxocara canis TaxID=6265 RepID=A0A0B2UXZ5_TOXCA|nr:Uncharacterized protein T05H10.3 [Toxocara canis]